MSAAALSHARRRTKPSEVDPTTDRAMLPTPDPSPPAPTAPMLYDTRIRHTRIGPVRHAFCSRSYQWLVDLDDLPRLGWLSALAGFRSADHVGDPRRSLRANLGDLLASRQIDLGGGRIVMLANARVLGHVFNPLSLFWCYADDGRLRCVVLEVHNTYGERHAYVVETDASGRAEVDKALYVSPFNASEGHYDLRLPPPGGRLDTTVQLRQTGQPPFVATWCGQAVPATRLNLIRLALRRPLEPLRTSARIRWHGSLLWLRGLPVQPRRRR